jgi:hypothetical protein
MNALETYITQRQALFWSVSPEKKKQINPTLLVETILNYGTLVDIKLLFEILGLKECAKIFFSATENRSRSNYFPAIEHYFRLYFQRHAR